MAAGRRRQPERPNAPMGWSPEQTTRGGFPRGGQSGKLKLENGGFKFGF